MNLNTVVKQMHLHVLMCQSALINAMQTAQNTEKKSFQAL